MPETERAKLNSPVLADFRDSAKRNGYSTPLAEAMVTIGHSIHYIEDGEGTKRLVDQAEYDDLIKDGWKPVRERSFADKDNSFALVLLKNWPAGADDDIPF